MKHHVLDALSAAALFAMLFVFLWLTPWPPTPRAPARGVFLCPLPCGVAMPVSEAVSSIEAWSARGCIEHRCGAARVSAVRLKLSSHGVAYRLRKLA